LTFDALEWTLTMQIKSQIKTWRFLL
jgi:hypothetical protein